MAAGEFAGKENVTSARPLLYARPDGTFVALTDSGANGSKKSFDAWDFLPDFLPDAIIHSFNFVCYAERSPNTTQESVARLNSVQDDHCVRSFRPGVELTVTPLSPAIVTCPVDV